MAAPAVRYEFTKPARDEAQLQAEIAALGVAGFVGVCGSGDTAEALFAAPLSVEGRDAVAAVVAAHVPDPGFALAPMRAVALTTLLTRADETGLQVRAVVAAVVFLVNERLAALGQPRVLEPEILRYIAANPMLGDPVVG